MAVWARVAVPLRVSTPPVVPLMKPLPLAAAIAPEQSFWGMFLFMLVHSFVPRVEYSTPKTISAPPAMQPRVMCS